MYRVKKDFFSRISRTCKLWIWTILWVIAVLAAAATLTLLWQPERSTPLVSINSGKCISVLDGGAEEERVFQLDCIGQSNEMWHLQKIMEDGIGGAPYRLVNASSGRCLRISDELFGGARVVVQKLCSDGNEKDQLWVFDVDKDRGNGWIYGQLVNMQKWSCLDVNGGETAEGAPVVEWECNQQANQRFRVPKEIID